MCNKGDHTDPDCRARLVACEVNKGNTKEETFFASTPPLDAKKAICMTYATKPTSKGLHMRLSFVDINETYLNATPKRNLCMNFPKELGLPPGLVARHV